MRRPETPSHSDVEGIFEKENCAVTPSRWSTLRRHMFVLLCLLALARLSSSSCDPSSTFFFSILRIGTLSLAWTLLTFHAKGTTGAWSILLMARTRVVVDLDLKNCVMPALCKNTTRLGGRYGTQWQHKSNLMMSVIRGAAKFIK